METEDATENLKQNLTPSSIKEESAAAPMPIHQNGDTNGDMSKITNNLIEKSTTSPQTKLQDNKEVALAATDMEKVLITICSSDRKKKKAFMSVPRIQEVLEKAKKYGLIGTTIVLESNGCEVCEDEVITVLAKEKNLFMLLTDNEEYTSQVDLVAPTYTKPLVTYSPITAKKDKQTKKLADQIYFADSSIILNTNDSTLSNDETISMTSVTPSAMAARATTIFGDFTIPWHKVPSETMKLFQAKCSLGKRMNSFGNFIVDELRMRSTHISSQIFRNVAQQAASKYPDSLLEKDREGQLISTTPQALISKMINRNNSLNRKRLNPNKFEMYSPSKKRKTTTSSNISNVSIDLSIDSKDNMESKKNVLIELSKDDKSVNRETIINYMKQTFPLQRGFFNNSEKIPNINAIMENWPYVFDREVLYQYFELLMSINPRIFDKNFKENKERIYKFFKTTKNKQINNLDETETNLLRGLAYYFNEDPVYIFKYFEHGTTLETIEDINPTNAPWLGLIKNAKNSAENDAIAYIFIENKIVAKCDFTSNSFADMITQLLCYYYAFNMMYPKEVTQTLEFIVKYYLKYCPEQTRKNANTYNKFTYLINKLQSINC